MKRLLLTNLLFSVLLISCNGQSIKEKNIETLDTVWKTINTQYFDSTFGGLDWQKEYEHYKPIIEKCGKYDSIFIYLNEMLFKLNVSHLAAVPPGYENEIGTPQLFLDGTIGLDVRLINEEAIVISVKKNSVADKSGIKAGDS